jgi:hypothetical protein
VPDPGPSQHHKSDWELEQEERNWREGEVRVPSYPKAENLIEFFVSAASSFRFFIDRASLSVGKDGVVRYTLVARSPSGAENVSYEGIRCRTGIYKVYARGRSDGTWSERPGDWRAIEPKSVQRWHNELRRDYFCHQNMPIHDAREAIEALRRGGLSRR